MESTDFQLIQQHHAANHCSDEKPCLNTAEGVAQGVGDQNTTLLIIALPVQHKYAKSIVHCPCGYKNQPIRCLMHRFTPVLQLASVLQWQLYCPC